MVGILKAIEPRESKITILGGTDSTKHVVEDRSVMNVNATRNIMHSDNWSGYVKSGGPFQSVKGAWNVPSVAGVPGTDSAAWIGIDGNTDTTLIQTTGTDQGFSGGGAGSFAYPWWEVLPAPETQIPFTVMPSDMMKATISPVSALVAVPNVPVPWVMTLTDSTAGWTFPTVAPYAGMLSSAEWIMEDPSSCSSPASCVLAPFTIFANITFDVGDAVMPGSNAAGLRAFNTAESIDMVQNGITFASPSVPDCDGDGFTVGFGPSAPTAPGPFFTTLTLPGGFVGVPYSATLSVSGLAFPFAPTFAGAQDLQLEGLSLASPSGKITGVPKYGGTFQFDATVTDSKTGATCDGQMSIQVAPTIHRPYCVYSRELHKWFCFWTGGRFERFQLRPSHPLCVFEGSLGP